MGDDHQVLLHGILHVTVCEVDRVSGESHGLIFLKVSYKSIHIYTRPALSFLFRISQNDRYMVTYSRKMMLWT